MIQLIGTTVSIIISLFVVCIYFRFMKRAFDTFAKEDAFPFRSFAPIVSIMTIQVWSIVLAFFLGSPIFQFKLNNFTQQLMFISVITITIGVMRLVNIIYPRAVNHDVVVWSCVAVGILLFILINIPGFILETLSEIISLDKQQFQLVSLMVFIGTFLITIIVEVIGMLYKKIDTMDGSRS
ncbi:MAG: hypothetical protein Q7U34_04775 [Anaerolineales bacterium]|nr:hypothetical protein [Anaerolineales bacterium]